MERAKCSVCGAPAVVHLQQLEGEIERSVDLCESCARNYGVLSNSSLPFSIVQSVSATLFNQLSVSQTRSPRHCSGCGCTAETLMKRSHVGCVQCYEDLQNDLMAMLCGNQKSFHHVGRRPKPLRTRVTKKRVLKEPDTLVLKLKKAIEEERFEEVAILRDQLSENERG
ncbi:MAG: hypothetical protein LW808_003660 [Verrucomicrobiota bacterium]|nr:MAG: hypothetical protein LW808_003660 [Verrucomicrobiota bacterium]